MPQITVTMQFNIGDVVFTKEPGKGCCAMPIYRSYQVVAIQRYDGINYYTVNRFKPVDTSAYFEMFDANNDGILEENAVPSEVWQNLQQMGAIQNGVVTQESLTAANAACFTEATTPEQTLEEEYLMSPEEFQADRTLAAAAVLDCLNDKV